MRQQFRDSRSASSFSRKLIIGTAAIALVMIALTGCGAGVDPLGAKVGDRAPDFTLSTPDGSQVTLSDYRGTPVLLYFWATWCGTCTFDLPDIDEAAVEGSDGSVVAITVNIGEQPELVEGFVLDSVPDYSFIVATDPATTTFLEYRILSIPMTFFVDAEGYIRHMKTGRISGDNIEKGLAATG